jgi:hypothetical protein
MYEQITGKHKSYVYRFLGVSTRTSVQSNQTIIFIKKTEYSIIHTVFSTYLMKQEYQLSVKL